MKSNFLFTSVLLITFSYSHTYSQISKTDLQNDHILGKVKSITQTKSGSKYQSDNRKNEYFYNTKGNLSSEINYWNGKVSSRTEYVYDAKGFLISKTDKDTSGKITGKELYKNDLKGNVIQQTSSGEVGVLYNINYRKYDPKGKMIEEISKKDNGETAYKKVFKYNEKGTLTKSDFHMGNDDWITETEITPKYNAAGLVEEEYVFTSPSMSGIRDFDRGSRAYLYYPNGELKYEASEFDDSANMHSYDEKGNITEEIHITNYGGKTVSKYKYEFDASGNWIKQSKINDNEIQYLIERLIVYY